jgi:hypothetical protein
VILADPGTLGTGHVKRRTPSSKGGEPEKGEPKNKDKNVPPTESAPNVDKVLAMRQAILELRDNLIFSERRSGISHLTDNYYEILPDGTYMKMPVRQESNGVQCVPNYKQISYGWFWSGGGTNGLGGHNFDPINGMQDLDDNYASWADFSYTLATTSSNWAYHHLGRIWHAIENNIRSHKNISAADIVKMVKALGGYVDMALGILFYTSYYHAHLDGYINKALAGILATSEGSPMFTTKDELRTQIIRVIQENWFPWPFFNFWKDRFTNVLSMQMDWYKYMLFIPYDDNKYVGGLARIFDGFIDDAELVHPETYLREEGLFDLFRDNLAPLIWGIGDRFSMWTGINPEDYLKNIGFRPVEYNAVKLQFIRKGYFLWPFDETLGVGQDKAPQDLDDNSLSLPDYFYGYGYVAGNDFDQPGQTIFVYPDAYLIDRHNRNCCVSPYLDMEYWGSFGVQSHMGSDPAPSHGFGQTLRGSLDYAGETFSDLDYDEFIAFFPDMFLRCTELETIKPDPDIHLQEAMGATTPKHQDLVGMLDPFVLPFRMPPFRWCYPEIAGVRRKMDWQYCTFLGLKLDDIEIFKQQRALPRSAENQA